MKSRADLVNDTNKESFFDLPQDMWGAIPSVAQEDEAIKMKRKLSMTCKPLYRFFQPSLDKSDAQRLLSYVLQGNAKEAKKMYEANPRLLFIEATAKEYAAGIDEHGNPVPRMETESPYQAAVRTGDIWMLQEIKEQIDKIKNESFRQHCHTLAGKQLTDVFPNGFEYPPSTYDFKGLVQAISNDPVLINATNFIKPGEASPNTEKVLAQFRKDFLPGNKKIGYHFNLNELIEACALYNSNCYRWNNHQAEVFWCQVVGYLERLVSACDAQALCQGIKNVLDGKPLERSFDLILLNPYIDYKEKKISYFPLADDPSCCLGGIFAVDSYYVGERPRAASVMSLKNYVQSKAARLEEFKRQLHKSVDQPEVSQDVQQDAGLLETLT